jgi:hypothetical protein
VKCTATDADAVNSPASVSFTITVVSVLALAQPGSITVDATSPAGAVVHYPVPAVSDPANAHPPAAVCTPASGSTFAIGTTTVTCTVKDPAATPASVSKSFTVTVLGAAAQLTDLAGALPGGVGGQLLAPDVAAAASALAAGQKLLATLDLDKFIAAVAVLEHAGAISPAAAQTLTAAAQQIIAVIGIA